MSYLLKSSNRYLVFDILRVKKEVVNICKKACKMLQKFCSAIHLRKEEGACKPILSKYSHALLHTTLYLHMYKIDNDSSVAYYKLK